jgi:CRP-like cAMP-binding protein
MCQHATASAPVRNLLLSSLPREDFARVQPHLETVQLKQREALFEYAVPIRHVYFPESAVISVATRLTNGATVEVGTAGCEGMVGLTLFLADGSSPVTAFAQLPGVVRRMSAEAFTVLASAPGTLHQILLRYAEAFLSQIAQTAACNATHLVEERCARWLLATHDRVDGDKFPLTQEYLAFMLGVRRTGVSLAMHDLQAAGMVQYDRGEVEVLDRARLEGVSCECYLAVRAQFERLLPRSKEDPTLLPA